MNKQNGSESSGGGTQEGQQQQGRRALQRLTGDVTEFDRVINLIYEYREHAPGVDACQVMRSLLSNNMNIRDGDAIKALTGLIAEARTKRIQDAIKTMGFDEAEKLLGMKKGDRL